MGPGARGEAHVAVEGKDVVKPRSSSTSPPVAGVEGPWPGDLQPFSNLGEEDRRGPTRSSRRGQDGGKTGASPGVKPGAKESATSTIVSGPVEGRPKRAVKQPVRFGHPSP